MNRKYLIKSFKALGLATLMLTGQSCQDVLKEEVISNIGNDYINTPAGLNAAINGAYSTLRSFYGTQMGLTVTEYGTDIYSTGADGSYKGFHYYDASLNSQVDWLKLIWEELYRGVNTCNAVIGRINNVTGISDAVKKQRVAEMKFLRGLYYYQLLMQWGGVDLHLTENSVPTKVASRASEADMYKAIIADLEAAMPDLEAKKASTDYGRATKPACEHLLAKVYLSKAYSSSKASDDFSKAETYAKDVISGGYGFKLLADFADVFAIGGGEVNDEVVWSVQYTNDVLTTASSLPYGGTNTSGDGNTGGNNLHLFFGMQYDVQAGMVRDVAYGRPFKRLRPTNYLINTVFADRTNDSRYKKTFRDTWLSNAPGTFNTAFDASKAKVTFKAGDTAIYMPGYEMSLAERAKRPYQVLVPSAYNQALFPTLIKFMDPLRPDRTWTAGSRDFLAFRLADTYLLLAEAQIGQGKAADAATNINAVRVRAAFAGKAEAMKITAAQATLDFIMEERARELAGEQTRWIDLRRWGKLVERVKLYSSDPEAKANIKDMHNLRPIPQTQIERTEGGSKSFPQNPGY
jgi:starch-binding outer membrane protein, SusD/RagB family